MLPAATTPASAVAISAARVLTRFLTGLMVQLSAHCRIRLNARRQLHRRAIPPTHRNPGCKKTRTNNDHEYRIPRIRKTKEWENGYECSPQHHDDIFAHVCSIQCSPRNYKIHRRVLPHDHYEFPSLLLWCCGEECSKLLGHSHQYLLIHFGKLTGKCHLATGNMLGKFLQ